MDSLRMKIWKMFQKAVDATQDERVRRTILEWRRMLGIVGIELSEGFKTARIGKTGDSYRIQLNMLGLAVQVRMKQTVYIKSMWCIPQERDDLPYPIR